MAARVLSAALAVALCLPVVIRAQEPDTTALLRALNFEGAGKYREAAVQYKDALKGADPVSALLGLERAYAQLQWTDSLLAPLDSLIAAEPREPAFRAAQLRAYSMLSRDAEVRRAFDAWVKAVPGSPDPYREYSRLLLEQGRAAAADSVIALAGRNLGTTSSLQMELAQSRAALGEWESSAMAWRGALSAMPDLDQAAAYSLARTPEITRATIRAVFMSPPVDVGSRRALSDLEATWGSAADGWAALRDLPPDSESVDAWLDFARQAEADERWSLARDAYVAALAWHPTPAIAVRAATAALNAGDPGAALALLPTTGVDSAHAASIVLPLRVRALAAEGKPADAEALVNEYSTVLVPAQRAPLEQAVAFGWVRAGDLPRARRALAGAGPDADSSDAAGWLALYDGDLAGARAILRNSTDASPDLARALGLITRMKEDSATDVGLAFLQLARQDSAGAATAFERAATHHTDVAPALLGVAAQLRAARGDAAGAVAIWTHILGAYPQSPEAPAAELAWARQLRGTGAAAGAVQHLEHMILSYPDSALLPQARRELELARQAIPGGGQGGL
ncbi:MAG TPA: hypothetical protein VIJ16_06565 [Gemmatimonadaceae bacterium]